jgi:hypothetical protein
MSTDSPAGRHAPVALGGGGAVELAHALVVKVIPVAPWPKTRSAIVSPAPVAPTGAAIGWLNSSTRELFTSAT